MTVERTGRRATSEVDRELRDATGARSDAPTAGGTVEHETSTAGIVGHAAEVGHMAIDTAALTVEMGGGAAAAGGAIALAAGATPILAGIALYAGIAHQLEGADATNRQLHTSRMEGMLAALEGRSDDAAVRARAARNPGYAEGLRAAERFARERPDDFARAVRVVRQSRDAGLAAVALGRDRTPAAQRRYESDPAFRNAVDYMRRLQQPVERGGDPQRYDREVDAVRRRQSDVERGRHGAAVHP